MSTTSNPDDDMEGIRKLLCEYRSLIYAAYTFYCTRDFAHDGCARASC